MLNVHSTRLNANRHRIIWVKPICDGLCILLRGKLVPVSEHHQEPGALSPTLMRHRLHHDESWRHGDCVICCKCLHTFHVAVVLLY